MKHFLHLTDFTPNKIHEIFKIADELQSGKYNAFLNGKIVAMFLPQKSLWTRITFEKGINLLGGQEVSSDAIDSKYFVGYEFKKRMHEVEQAIIIFCLTR
jgi:ornithine carbamoyltransferase